MTTDPLPASTPDDVVFVGACMLQGGKLGSAFIPADRLGKYGPDDSAAVERDSSPFALKPNMVVGGVYRAPVVREGDRIRRLGAREFLKRADHPLVSFWEIRHRAAELADRQAKAEKKAKANLVAMGEVEALAAMYYLTPSRERFLFEAVIVDLIRAGAAKLSRERIAANARRLGLSS